MTEIIFYRKKRSKVYLERRNCGRKLLGLNLLKSRRRKKRVMSKNLENGINDNNYATRTIMINTMSKAQVLKYCSEKSVDKLWNMIKYNMAAESEQIKARALNDLTNLRMNKNESVDNYINRAEALKNQCVQLENQ